MAEAEGRAFRSSLSHLVLGLILLLGGGVLLLTAVWIFLYGVYRGFVWAFGGSQFGAALVTAAITLVIAGVMLWIGKLVTRG